jgi:NAD(P)-dependent dehydrogenase (short-subunit alcohol dehydrogenase family)
VTRPADHRDTHAYLAERYGRLDILVNNAAILVRDSSSLVHSEELRRVFETNFFGTVELTQALLPLIRRSPAGRIVNVSSIVGSLTLHSDPKSRIYDSKIFSYDASKTALNAFTIHLAYELRGTKIKVNSADPGWVKTDMGGEHALVEVSEGGKTSVRLATVPDDGPNGGFFRLDESFPW